ncbi:MAG: helix-turn-helix transcriptional regulator [Oscillospiraceae bacterium]
MYNAHDTIDNRKLVKAMTQKGMKTSALASQTGITACTISHLRTGNRNTCLKTTTFRIADALGIEPSEIVSEV